MGTSATTKNPSETVYQHHPKIQPIPDGERAHNYSQPRDRDLLRINVGCGRTPVPGWRNYDSSPSVKLAYRPVLGALIQKFGRVTEDQKEFIRYVRATNIRFADVTKKIPEADSSADVIYSCHMVEHIERDEALAFFAEAQRVLKSGGIIRIAVPDIRWHVNNFLEDGDADRFIRRTKLTREMPKTFFAKVKSLVVGDRSHKWMYDGSSMCQLLTKAGFLDAKELKSGETSIENPGDLNLRERAPESVFLEAVNP